ncbi:hypothetical protein WJX74_008210 [Apatococcus lobatus]|uniref:Uncharacterized protein n=1 Tax=Apatococcus lobatus TaxID=904363 RepID=A0AAW1RZ49_9CHLO
MRFGVLKYMPNPFVMLNQARLYGCKRWADLVDQPTQDQLEMIHFMMKVERGQVRMTGTEGNSPSPDILDAHH